MSSTARIKKEIFGDLLVKKNAPGEVLSAKKNQNRKLKNLKDSKEDKPKILGWRPKVLRKARKPKPRSIKKADQFQRLKKNKKNSKRTKRVLGYHKKRQQQIKARELKRALTLIRELENPPKTQKSGKSKKPEKTAKKPNQATPPPRAPAPFSPSKSKTSPHEKKGKTEKKVLIKTRRGTYTKNIQIPSKKKAKLNQSTPETNIENITQKMPKIGLMKKKTTNPAPHRNIRQSIANPITAKQILENHMNLVKRAKGGANLLKKDYKFLLRSNGPADFSHLHKRGFSSQDQKKFEKRVLEDADYIQKSRRRKRLKIGEREVKGTAGSQNQQKGQIGKNLSTEGNCDGYTDEDCVVDDARGFGLPEELGSLLEIAKNLDMLLGLFKRSSKPSYFKDLAKVMKKTRRM